MRRLSLMLAGLAAAGAVAAAPAWQFEAGAGAQSLGGGRSPWAQQDLALRARDAERIDGGIEWRRVERFERVDQEWALQVRAALQPGWWLGARATYSPEHRLLARQSERIELQHAAARVWLVDGQLQRSRYSRSRVDGAGLGVEHYLAGEGGTEWRWAARVARSRIGSAAGSSVQLQLDRFDAGGSRLGVIVAGGREPETDDRGATRLLRQSTAALVARWPLGGRWALVGDLGATRVDSSYWRRGGRLGVQLDL